MSEEKTVGGALAAMDKKHEQACDDWIARNQDRDDQNAVHREFLARRVDHSRKQHKRVDILTTVLDILSTGAFDEDSKGKLYCRHCGEYSGVGHRLDCFYERLVCAALSIFDGVLE